MKGTAIAMIEGIIRRDWKFQFFSLDETHIASIAQGPLLDAISSYQTEVWKLEDIQTTLANTVKTESDEVFEEVNPREMNVQALLSIAGLQANLMTEEELK
jgi:hypothetical protein